MKYNEFITKVKEYESIVVFRHNRPDMDALGSQIGLAEVLKSNYPNKKIYITGDASKRYSFIGTMDVVSDEIIKDSLAIICDVACKAMVSDERYQNAKEIIVIDHHKNECDIDGAQTIVETARCACAELIANIVIQEKLNITPTGATALYAGIVTDSGRFQYAGTTAETFKIASWLVEQGANMSWVYDKLYVETLAQRRMKDFFCNHYETTDEGVAYMFNDSEILAKFPGVSFFDISRGMVNVMAGIEEITIWCNFTYDGENDKVIGEFRSRGFSIVDIAKKYGGGGHDNACGATLKDFAEAKLILEDFKQRALEKR